MENSTDDARNCSASDPLCELIPSSVNIDVIINTTYIAIGVVGLFANSLVAGVLLGAKRSTPKKRSITSILIINQCFINGLTSMLIIPASFIQDVDLISSSIGKELFCRLWVTKVFIWGLFVSSTYNMVTVIYERLCALADPKTHRMKFKRERLAIIIFGIWISGPAFEASYIVPTSGIQNGECATVSNWPNIQTNSIVAVIVLVVEYYLPLGLLIYAFDKFVRAFRAASKSSKTNDANSTKNSDQTKSDQTGGGSSNTASKEEEAEKPSAMTTDVTETSTSGAAKPSKTPVDNTSAPHDKTTSQATKSVSITLALVSASFVLCWSWNSIYFTMYNFGYPVDLSGPFFHFSVIVVFLNCCTNPIIFAIRHEHFHRGLRTICCGEKIESASFESLAGSGSQQFKKANSEAALVGPKSPPPKAAEAGSENAL